MSTELTQPHAHAVDRGVLRKEIAEVFGVSMPTIKRWLKRRRETGEVKLKPILGPPARKGVTLEEALPAQLASCQPRFHPRRASRAISSDSCRSHPTKEREPVPAFSPYIVKPIWEQFVALLPQQREADHPLCC